MIGLNWEERGLTPSPGVGSAAQGQSDLAPEEPSMPPKNGRQSLLSRYPRRPLPAPQARLDRRGFLKFAGGAAAAASLAACTPVGQLAGRPTAGNIQLVYQDWRTDWFPALAQQMLDQFRSSHPDIGVFYSPDPENLESEMIEDFQSGSAPDVMAGCCDWFAIWAQQGYMLDLRPFVEADLDQEIIDDWDPAQYTALFTPDGQQFALPKYHGALGLYFNKDIFDAYGVDHPDGSWDHDDYLAAMKLLTHDTDGDGQVDQWGSMLDIAWERIQVHVNAWGGHFVDPNDPTRSWLGRAESLAAMEWLRQRIWVDHVMASFLDVDNVETRQAFLAGQLAMVEDGSWALKDILENATFRFGVAPFPAGPAGKVTLATTDGFGIYADTTHPEASWELLKFLVSREYGLAMAEAHLLQPARRSLVPDWAKIIRQQYPEQARDLDVEVFAEGHEQGYSVTAEIFANMAPARELTQAAWQQIFTLGQSPVDEMLAVSARIELAQSISQ